MLAQRRQDRNNRQTGFGIGRSAAAWVEDCAAPRADNLLSVNKNLGSSNDTCFPAVASVGDDNARRFVDQS